MAGRIVIGTSSWADPGFVAEWYPNGMAARDRLAWYAEGFLLQLSPSFSPRAHELEELRPLVERLAPHPTAIELRNRNWVDGERTPQTLESISDLGAAWVGVDAPPADHFTIMPPVDAVT